LLATHATHAAIERVKQEARAQDVVVVYFSGHGKTYRSNGKDQFHYLTHEVSSGNVGKERATKNAVISSEELTQLLKTIPAYKQVLIIDACNSGKLIDDIAQNTKALNSSQIRALTRMSDRTGLYLITGSAADMVSFESGKYGQGLLTYALLKGMNSDQVLRQDDQNTYLVGVTELFEFAKNEVVDLAKDINGIQRPQVNFPLRAGSFPIGIFNEQTKIILPEAKPVLIRSVFQNSSTLIDDLEMAGALEAAFREEMGQGRAARLIYLDVNNAANAYRIGGRYSVAANGTIEVQANLVKAGAAPIPLRFKRGSGAAESIRGKSVKSVVFKLTRAVYAELKE
ncbi:MAG: caspase family protein, partial [Bacteroidota bacterium]